MFKQLFKNWFYLLIVLITILAFSLFLYFVLTYKIEKYHNAILETEDDKLYLKNINWNQLTKDNYQVNFEINHLFYSENIEINSNIDEKILVNAPDLIHLMNLNNQKILNITLILDTKQLFSLLF
ncbi:MAG1140 family protein [Mycoplasma hafezii]|uniref:MAG1140 family protein n=1 Tax=Mycoplasma hafezii TaxID=525886 RepID=UPI003CEB6832